MRIPLRNLRYACLVVDSQKCVKIEQDALCVLLVLVGETVVSAVKKLYGSMVLSGWSLHSGSACWRILLANRGG